jgi:ABC-type uncharacterized transport system substrate-binding protein
MKRRTFIAGLGSAVAWPVTLPVVFVVGGDPVQLGLVTRLDRPDANVRGVLQ